MDLELWHLILLPVLFAAGWISRGVEKRQNEAEVTQTPEAYSQGVTLLLAGKEEKAIDCFIEAVRLEPERTDLHFILGRLFRGRGEFARAIRVHESLMNNADLPTEDRVEAIRALAEDYMTAGLFDRAEDAYRMLADIPDTHLDALRALLRIYIIEHEWTAAIDTARSLEKEAEEDRVGGEKLPGRGAVAVPDALDELISRLLNRIVLANLGSHQYHFCGSPARTQHIAERVISRSLSPAPVTNLHYSHSPEV